MPKHREKILLAWSGGKDCAMVHWELVKTNAAEVVGLVAVLIDGENRVLPHGTPADLLSLQADSLGLPIEFIYLPKSSDKVTRSEKYAEALASYREQGITRIAYGDIFLDDLRDFREELLESIGMEAVFPLWQRDTRELCYKFVNARFKALVTCVAEDLLDSSFAGRNFDRNFLADLPLSVDPCGENGEFHTFVYDGPGFRFPIPFKLSKHLTHYSCFHSCAFGQTLPRRKTSAKS